MNLDEGDLTAMNLITKTTVACCVVLVAGCPKTQPVVPVRSTSYIVKGDSVWTMMIFTDSSLEGRHAEIHRLSNRAAAASVSGSAITILGFAASSSWPRVYYADTAVLRSSVPKNAFEYTTFRSPVTIVDSGRYAVVGNHEHFAEGIFVLLGESRSQILANPRIEVRDDVIGDLIIVNGAKVAETINTVVVKPGTQRVQVVDQEKQDTLCTQSYQSLGLNDRECFYCHHKQRTVSLCPIIQY